MREGLGLCALVGRALRSGTEATTPSDSGDVRALAPGVLGRQCDMCVLAHVYSTLLVRLQRHLYRPRVYVSTVYAPTGRSPDTPRRAAPESRVTSVARRWSVERRPGPPLSFASALKSYPPGHLEHLDCVTGSPLRTHMASHHTTCRAPLPLSDTSHLTLHKCVSSSPSRACPPHVAS